MITFQLDDEAEKEFIKFQKKHNKKHGYGNSGALGRCFDVVFTCTGIGECASVICPDCKEEKIIQELN